jgi:hypothetical protein
MEMNQLSFGKPHHLLVPFGWAADAVLEFVASRPHLLADLLAIDSRQMHLIALVLAHFVDEPTPDIGELLTRGSVRAAMRLIPALDPFSMERVLDRYFPSSVLEPESYRQLVSLLADKNASSFLQNADYVSDTIIRTLQELPPPLRNRCVVNTLDPIELEYGFSDGLRLLVSRGAAPSFEALVSELASVSEEERLCSRIAELIEALPLPTAFPPPQIQNARRIDRAAEIRSLEEAWNTCLGHSDQATNNGTCALYLWEDSNISATCLVTREGRLGWFLNHIRFRAPTTSDMEHRATLRSAFDQAGFPPIQSVAAIVTMSRQATLSL